MLGSQVEVLVDRYLYARNLVCRSGFENELRWQETRQTSCVSESIFLREAAWVVLNAGMRESVIRNLFQSFSVAFLNWSRASCIVENRERCTDNALNVFANRRKVGAIVEIAGRVSELGISEVQRRLRQEGIAFVSQFPFMGPATSRHLAKNLGVDVAKPDRHLCRIASAAGFVDPQSLCQVISDYVPDRIAVVDIVLWRFSTLVPSYQETFRLSCKEIKDSQCDLASWANRPFNRGFDRA